jgi:hypothetical protein
MDLRTIKNYVCAKLHIASTSEFAENHAEMIDVANMVLDDLYGAISWKNLGYFGDFKQLDLTGSIRIYTLPSDILNKINKIDVYLSSDWLPLTIKQMSDYPDFIFTEKWITENFSNQKPVGFIHGGNLYILSGTVAAASPGVRLWYLDFPDPASSMDGTVELAILKTVNTPEGGTTAIGLPRQFHRLLANAIIIDYKEANEIPLVGRELLYDQDLAKKLSELSPLNTDEEIVAEIPYDTGDSY